MVSDASPERSKILIIGSSGFIGSHLSQRLARLGHLVRGFDLQPPAADFGQESTVIGDVRRSDDVRNALTGIDTVIQLAAVHFDFGHTDQEYFETNEGGMRVLLEAMSEQQVRRLIFVSSIAIYGDHMEWADEQTPPAPASPYGASKLAAERLVERWAAGDPTRNALILRPCAVYGERNVSNMMNLIRQIHSGYFVLFGSGRNHKATAYVGNLIDATVDEFNRLAPGIRTLNYADKPDLTVREIVDIIRRALGKRTPAIRLPLWLGLLAACPFELITRFTGKDLPVSAARLMKLNRPTQVRADRIRQSGFRQQVSSREGLERMVAHFLSQRSEWAADRRSEISLELTRSSLSDVTDATQNKTLECEASADAICSVHTRR